MKHAIVRFAGLVLFVALTAGTPLFSEREHRKEHNNGQNNWQDNGRCEDGEGERDRLCVTTPDSHAGPLLLLTAGVLGAAMLVQRRRKIAS